MEIRSSIRKLSILFIVFFIATSAVLVYWQVVAAQQVTNIPGLTLGRKCLPDSTPKRGNIYDRNGVLLAYSIPVPSNNPNSDGLCVYQRVYTDPALAPLIGYYISPKACAIFEFCSSGIEKQFDDYLSGRVGITGLSNDVNNVLHVPPVGDNIYLTIDVRAQNIVDKYFPEEAAHAPGDTSVFDTKAGSVIVTDPTTGQIIAMESQPGFDPNRIASGDTVYLKQLLSNPTQPLLDRAIDSCYVPGSVYKTMTLMAALDSGKFNLDSPFYNDGDPAHLQAIGPVRLGSGNDTETFGPVGNNITGYTFTYPVSLRYGYSHSDNIIFAQVGANTGVDTWLSYNHAFYVDKQIPFDLPVKVSTVTPQPQKNLCQYTAPEETALSVKQLAENAFGQGVDFITPLQMSLIDDAAANNGQLMRPTLIDKIVDPSGSVIRSFSPTVLGNPISSQTATEVRDAMYGVVACGSGSLVRVQLSYPFSPWSVIGKTGTGEVNGIVPAESWFITAAPYIYQSGSIPPITITAMKENGGEGAYANGPMLRDIYAALFTQVYKLTQPPAPDPNFCYTTGLLQPAP
jgi:peptidoglycan glycosyltransferase